MKMSSTICLSVPKRYFDALNFKVLWIRTRTRFVSYLYHSNPQLQLTGTDFDSKTTALTAEIDMGSLRCEPQMSNRWWTYKKRQQEKEKKRERVLRRRTRRKSQHTQEDGDGTFEKKDTSGNCMCLHEAP